MKVIALFFLAILTILTVSCDLFNSGDDPTSPPDQDKVYEVRLITQPTGAVLGWKCEIQYLGVGLGYMGRYNVNTQDKTVEWRSSFGPEVDVQVLVTDAADGEVATFIINNKRVVRTRDGVSITLNEQGWVEFSTDIWHVDLDVRQ